MVKKLELVCFVGSAMMDARNEGQQMGAFAGVCYGLGEPKAPASERIPHR
jgi:hypothetical protein